MDTNIKHYYDTIAEEIAKNAEKRRMQCFSVDTKEDAKKKILEIVPDKSSIAWGGSKSVEEIGILPVLKEEKSCEMIDRFDGKTPEDFMQKCIEGLQSDFYLMSTNAITRKAELINVDGRGNRVQALIMGPKHVIVVAGINKVVSDVAAGEYRVRNIAAPINAVRLSCETPCRVTGKCSDCLSKDCMCANTVITRLSKVPDRIILILVKETLGF